MGNQVKPIGGGMLNKALLAVGNGLIKLSGYETPTGGQRTDIKRLPQLETKKGLSLSKESLEMDGIVSKAGIKFIRLNRGGHHRFVFPDGLYIDYWPYSRRRSLHIPNPACIGPGKLSEKMERWNHYDYIQLSHKMVEWERNRTA